MGRPPGEKRHGGTGLWRARSPGSPWRGDGERDPLRWDDFIFSSCSCCSPPLVSQSTTTGSVLLAHSARWKTTPCSNAVVRDGCCKFEVSPFLHGCLFSHGQSDARRDPLTALYAPFTDPDVYPVGRATTSTSLLCLTKVELENHPLVLLPRHVWRRRFGPHRAAVPH